MRKLLAAMLCAAAACSSSGDKKNEQQTVATPAFSPAGGTYAAPQTVTITCATAGATIHYTTDGTTPTASSPAYATPVAISTTGTALKAMATLTGYTDSAVATATYVLQAATPTFSPAAGTYATGQSVTLTSATLGAAIHYTTDGSTPTAGSPTYAAPISVSTTGTTITTTTIRALATRTGFADSAVASAAYTINPAAIPAATPTFSPAAGSYASAQSVTLSTTSAGASIYYTLDGSTPTAASTLYTAAIPVAATTTIRAIATGGGFTASPVATATYTITLTPTATPVFSPVPGTYTSAQNVTITCATAGATIYYTTNGVDPTTSSTRYTAPVPVSSTTTLKAIATAPGLAPSAIASGTYTISGGTTFATLCAAVTTIQNNLQSSCLKVNPALLNSPGPFQFNFCADLQKEIDAGRILYNAGQGSACLTGFQGLTCNDLLPNGDFPTPIACDNALTGTVTTGNGCYGGDACQAGYCTSDYTQSCPGTCQPFAQLNQPCQSAQCAAGLACDFFSGGTPTCKTASGLNGACPCQDAFWCDFSGGLPGVCRAFRAAGGACSEFGGECAAGTECVGASSLPPVAGTCRALVGGGAACGATAPCGLGYTCPAGTCVSLPSLGQPCVQGTGFLDCIGGYCPPTASPTCQGYKVVGATCTVAFECASFQCSGTPAVCQPLTCAAP